jgi:hypothetical protein
MSDGASLLSDRMGGKVDGISVGLVIEGTRMVNVGLTVNGEGDAANVGLVVVTLGKINVGMAVAAEVGGNVGSVVGVIVTIGSDGARVIGGNVGLIVGVTVAIESDGAVVKLGVGDTGIAEWFKHHVIEKVIKQQLERVLESQVETTTLYSPSFPVELPLSLVITKPCRLLSRLCTSTVNPAGALNVALLSSMIVWASITICEAPIGNS